MHGLSRHQKVLVIGSWFNSNSYHHKRFLQWRHNSNLEKSIFHFFVFVLESHLAICMCFFGHTGWSSICPFYHITDLTCLYNSNFLLRKAIFAIASLSLLVILPTSVAAQEFSDNVQTPIEPVYLSFKLHKEPVVCLFGTDERDLHEGVESVLDWQKNLRSYTNNTKSWNMNTVVNPSDTFKCDIEIRFLKKPTQASYESEKIQGAMWFTKNNAIVEIYTTQYYNDEAIKYVKDKSGKARPVIGEFEDVPIALLGKVTRHELGHVFGLQHEQSNSIMVTGPVLAEITDKDCKEVLREYSNGW